MLRVSAVVAGIVAFNRMQQQQATLDANPRDFPERRCIRRGSLACLGSLSNCNSTQKLAGMGSDQLPSLHAFGEEALELPPKYSVLPHLPPP
ncbi:hypothetical protein KC367_g104 [Hortaea werneckii]|nr:hypothetical protein KC367_g104 [Hortaea werneckii]